MPTENLIHILAKLWGNEREKWLVFKSFDEHNQGELSQAFFFCALFTSLKALSTGNFLSVDNSGAVIFLLFLLKHFGGKNGKYFELEKYFDSKMF